MVLTPFTVYGARRSTDAKVIPIHSASIRCSRRQRYAPRRSPVARGSRSALPGRTCRSRPERSSAASPTARRHAGPTAPLAPDPTSIREPEIAKGRAMGVLDGKAAIVTGSARGIGRATAALLSEHGARVLINDVDGDVAEQAASEIEGEAAVFAGDLTAEGAPEALVQAAVDAFAQIDIVVNNAGYTWDGMAHKMSDEQFRAMLEIHTVVPFKVLRAAAPDLRDAGKKDKEEGREIFRKVVNVTSISGTQGNVGQINYAAAKAGLVGLTKTLAREWGPFKVNVNAVAFGFVETRMTAELPQQMRDMAPMIIPLGRPAQPEEAAGAIFFLCTPWSNFVHGQVITAS